MRVVVERQRGGTSASHGEKVELGVSVTGWGHRSW